MSAIEHTVHPNGVHEVMFSVASRASIEDLMTVMESVFQQTPPVNNAHYILLDLRASGMLPLRHLTQRLRELLRAHPERPRTCIAMVLHDQIMKEVTTVLLRTILRREQVQYFTRYDHAHLWLTIEQNRPAAV